jgi:predicted nucleic acid-binding protein
MIVVSDTSPLTALLTVNESEILPQLFAEVIVPRAVWEELRRSHDALPDWLKMREVSDTEETIRLAGLVDRGEAEAIELAKELHADRLLIDERKGRKLAADEGVPVIGLLGVVLLAKRRGLVQSARVLMTALRAEAGVYLSDDLVERALSSVGE